jgi:hypothetical protein
MNANMKTPAIQRWNCRNDALMDASSLTEYYVGTLTPCAQGRGWNCRIGRLGAHPDAIAALPYL